MTLTEELKHLHITPDPGAIARAQDRWSHVAKPLGSLGVLERNIVRIAGIQADPLIDIEKKALVIMCADNGVVAEGVTQTGQEVTAVVTENFTKGDSCVCLMARRAGTDVFPVDIGVAGEVRDLGVHPLIRRKIRPGTENMAKCPAMTRQEAEAAVRVGMELVGELKSKGYKIIATGEMGIGNTTTSSAVLAAFMGCPAAEVTGRGAGLNDEGLERKIRVIDRAIALHRPDPLDGLDVLSKVGGLDLAGLAGVFIGGAVCGVPVVVDGFISAAAACAAAVIFPDCRAYMLGSHRSGEPGMERALAFLGLETVIDGGLCLGEGTGAVALLPLLDMAADIYREMSTFAQIEIEEYKPL